MADPAAHGDYVLGTHDDEIARLGLQHRVWRPYASEAWARAGFTVGQTLLDVGCGPGYATLDLAEIVGSSGRVVALERSARFLGVLDAARRARNLSNIETHQIDLDTDPLPDVRADGAWGRWVFAFVRDPRALLRGVAERLRPGGALVVHEYFDYGTWRLSPPVPEQEEFVRLVIEGWRASGGEPNVGLTMLPWLADAGFCVRAIRPLVHVATPGTYVWEWPTIFVGVGLRRLVELGRVTPDRADAILRAFEAGTRAPNAHMVTPGLLEIVAERV